MPQNIAVSHNEIYNNVKSALQEDIGSGDITAQLIEEDTEYSVKVITRERATICGVEWANETFKQVDSSLVISWHAVDGEQKQANDVLFTVTGKARSILTAERTALNFLQLLSGTATCCREYADLVAHTTVKLLDTRKTIPGLRQAQKYAVHKGGCYNHRIGLYDAFLIKENHIAACGSITNAVKQAKLQQPGKTVEVEVENFSELDEALIAAADIIMLDNFTPDELVKAVAITDKQATLEASGNIDKNNLVAIAETGVDFISIGALSKHVRAVDLSMRFSI